MMFYSFPKTPHTILQIRFMCEYLLLPYLVMNCFQITNLENICFPSLQHHCISQSKMIYATITNKPSNLSGLSKVCFLSHHSLM